MKKTSIVIAAATFFSLVTVSNSQAYTISFGGAPGTGGSVTSSLPGAIVWDFDGGNLVDGRPGVFASINADTAEVVTGSVAGLYAAPGQTDTSPYLAVPASDSETSSGYIEIGLTGLYTYLGLYWGSADDYNTITFYNGASELFSLTGVAVLPPANGDQYSALTNLYVNFSDLPAFDSFKLSSNGRAFEVDNIAVGNPVPEPATMLLFGAGLAGLAGSRLRRKK